MSTEEIVAIITAVSTAITALVGSKVKQKSDSTAEKITASVSSEVLSITHQISALAAEQTKIKDELKKEFTFQIETVRLQVDQIAKSSANNRELLDAMREQFQKDIKTNIEKGMEPLRVRIEWIDGFMEKVRNSKVVGGK